MIHYSTNKHVPPNKMAPVDINQQQFCSAALFCSDVQSEHDWKLITYYLAIRCNTYTIEMKITIQCSAYSSLMQCKVKDYINISQTD